MAIPDRSHQYGSIFGDWHIGQMLGTGSGGKSAVFSLYRDNNGWREYCALKVISLIEEQGRQESMPQFRRNEYSTAVREQQKHAELEIRLMDQVRGKTNIVTYLDHKFFNWHDRNGFGVDLLIRMEKLTDLRRQMRNGKCFSDSEIIRIGQDICQALVICHSKNILHRDIKPENIFISEDGDYKLGDFGISRILDGTASALASTGIGTMAYCAPEQFSGAYDRRVDIYSLGLVLYELANNNHLPFAQSAYAGQEAIQTRLSGKPLPSPGGRNPGSRLVQVILKACAHKPENRYASAEAMLQALNSLSGNTVPDSERTTNRISRSPSVDPEYPTNVIASGTFSPEQTTRMPLPEEDEKPSHRGAGFYLAIILPAVLGVVALIAVASILLFKPSHTHSYLDATCESPRICAECGETEGAALNHRWQDATCSTPRTCVDCGTTSGETLTHQWLDATCQSPKTCQVCGETTGDYGHQWSGGSPIAPRSCSVCGTSEGSVSIPDTVYLNELPYLEKHGKLWTMGEDEPGYFVHSSITDGSVYDDWTTPGHTTGPVYDYLGNRYIYGMNVDGSDLDDYYISFHIGGFFNTFTATCSMTPDLTGNSSESNKVLEIWGDGMLLETVEISPEYAPQEICLNISGVEVLTIRYPKSPGPSRIANIYDAMLDVNTYSSSYFVTVTSDVLAIRDEAGIGPTSVIGYYVRGNVVEILETTYVKDVLWGRTDQGWICMVYVEK